MDGVLPKWIGSEPLRCARDHLGHSATLVVGRAVSAIIGGGTLKGNRGGAKTCDCEPTNGKPMFSWSFVSPSSCLLTAWHSRSPQSKWPMDSRFDWPWTPMRQP